jgi:hypothetical protein
MDFLRIVNGNFIVFYYQQLVIEGCELRPDFQVLKLIGILRVRIRRGVKVVPARKGTAGSFVQPEGGKGSCYVLTSELLCAA